MASAKHPSESRTLMTELVLPNDTNGLGNLMGGRLLHLMDVCAAIAAQRHASRLSVTASVDFVEFSSAIVLGEVVIIEAVVNRAFRTSMEVELNVWAENPTIDVRRKCNKAYYTFVAVDEKGRPTPVPAIVPTGAEETERFEGAARRRELRLLMAGRLRAQDADDIRNYLMAAAARKQTNDDNAPND